MARTRSILHIRSSSTLVFTYRRNNPSSGLYFDNVAITACTVAVLNADTGATILAATAMTYVAGQDGYRYVWAYGSLLDGVRAITVKFVPTRAVATPAALAPSTTEDYDLSDIERRTDDLQTAMLNLLQDPATGLGAIKDLLDSINTTLAAMEGAGWTTGYASLKAIRDAIQTVLDNLPDTSPGGSSEGPGGSL